jgi:hypothetical protein
MNPYAHAVIYSALALAFLTWLGNVACRILFKITKLSPETTPETNNTQNTGMGNTPSAGTSGIQRAGRVIGCLERMILAVGIVTHSWEVLAAVIALKTIGRFKDLDDKPFTDYFLVGSLFSVLWAVLITSSWLIYDHEFGIDLSSKISTMIEPPAAICGRC